MTVKFTTVPSKRLAETINGSAYSFSLQDIKGWNGSNLTSADFGTDLYASFRNSLGTKMELMKIDPATIASSSITILKRGLGFDGDQTTEVTANIQDVWVKGDTIVELGSHVSQLLEETVRKSGAQTIAGVKTFTEIPQTAGIATDSNDVVNYATALSMLTGSTSVNRIQVAGTAGENLTVGNLVYLKLADGLWWKCDADTAATVENIVLGIAQATTTAAASISGGVLLQGLDTNQTGLTDKTTYYASNTAGAISSTPGTTEVTLGVSRSTTSLLFIPRYNQQLTEDQQDALAGTVGTPSGSNKFVTNNDTFGPSSASLLRSTVRNGGSGADGALAVSSGTTNIDLGGAAVVVKNYKAISITGTGAISFSNPNANGTVIVFKSQGDVTVTSSANPVIDLRGLGSTGGAVGTNGTTGVGGGGAGGGSMSADGSPGGSGSTSDGTAGTTGTTANGIFVKIAGGTGGSKTTTSAGGVLAAGTLPSQMVGRGLPLAPGSGGGGAAGGNPTTACVPGAGGRGAGTLYIETAGAYNFTTGTINASGTAGSNGSGTFGSGGGGGGGGCILVSCASITANSGTYTTSGGAGGTTGSGAVGGAGAAGSSLVFVNTEFN